MRILIAEDNKFTALQYKIALEKFGHEVVVVHDGNECVKKYVKELTSTEFDSIEKHPFDLVMLDHNMPQKSGAKAAKEILSKKPNQKILFASGYLHSFIEDQTGQKVHKKIQVIEKPFSINTLLRKIKSIENS